MRDTKAGFSLVEAVITIILIAIAAVVALSFVMGCHVIALHTDARVVAANFARETMEGLYKRAYNDAALNLTAGTSVPLPAASAFGGGFLSRYPGATRNYTITDEGDYKLIIVTVTWNR